jgi:hypothetical protein
LLFLSSLHPVGFSNKQFPSTNRCFARFLRQKKISPSWMETK